MKEQLKKGELTQDQYEAQVLKLRGEYVNTLKERQQTVASQTTTTGNTDGGGKKKQDTSKGRRQSRRLHQRLADLRT